MTCVVIGASSGLGRALAEELARRGHPLVLISSDALDLLPLASDLTIRFGVTARTIAADAAEHEGLAAAVERAVPSGQTIAAILFPVGAVEPRDNGLLGPELAERLVRVNLLSVSSVVARLLPRLISQGHGTIVGFGSVAGLRGRSSNVLYAAAKRALESYFESLRLLGEPRGLTVAFYVLGYIDTQLSYGRRLLLPAADPKRVAKRVSRALGRERGRRYLPWLWYPVVILLRATPWAVFRRLDI
ncbi:MAG: SDR family NAD(P)-dependent oxidoreductase [Thermoanaerobaculia bacterium]|jgi:short-subunit dehydrogenase